MTKNYLLREESSASPIPTATIRSDIDKRTSVEQFFYDWLQRITPFPVCPCDSSQLYCAYLLWCASHGTRPMYRQHLSVFISRQPGWEIVVRKRFDRTIDQVEDIEVSARMVLPPAITLAGFFRPGSDFRRSTYSCGSEWATAGYLAFAAALERATS